MFGEKCPRVAIVILNWNNYPDTRECLLSLKEIDYPNYAVILIDNGSTDGSAEKLKREFSECHFVFLKKNEGFAIGSNTGFAWAVRNQYDYVLSLNNDTIVHNKFLMELVQDAEKTPTAGIFSPKILSYHHPEIIDSAGHAFHLGFLMDRGNGKIDRGQFDQKTKIIGACAACALYRTGMLRDIGYFDESYGTNYEDAELSWRSHCTGWEAKFVPLSLVYHKRGATKKKHPHLFYQLEVLGNLENVVRTVKRHGTIAQKFLFAIFLFKNAADIIGKDAKGFNRPYAKALKKLLKR